MRLLVVLALAACAVAAPHSAGVDEDGTESTQGSTTKSTLDSEKHLEDLDHLEVLIEAVADLKAMLEKLRKEGANSSEAVPLSATTERPPDETSTISSDIKKEDTEEASS